MAALAEKNLRAAGLLRLERYLDRVRGDSLREHVRRLLWEAPEEVWSAPASRSGRYHPACTHGPGGLVVHVCRAAWLLCELEESGVTRTVLPDHQRALMPAVLLHDTHKHDYTRLEALAAERVMAAAAAADGPGDDHAHWLADQAIGRRMGLWTASGRGLAGARQYQLIVYQCDYLASRPEIGTPEDHPVMDGCARAEV